MTASRRPSRHTTAHTAPDRRLRRADVVSEVRATVAPMGLELRELSIDNLRELRDLRLAPCQERFVAPVLESIAEAYVTPTAWPRAIVDGDEVVGFVMANWDPDNEIDAFRAGIWRLNVDASRQGSGVGRFAVGEVAAEARRRGVDRITVLWERGENSPEGFYLRCGFAPTGEELFGEVVGVLQLDADDDSGRSAITPAAGHPAQ